MESNTNTARFLDMTDRVDVLGSIYRSCESEEDFQCLDALMGEYYPSLLQFYAESCKKEAVVSIHAVLEENAIGFIATFENGSCEGYHYNEIDPLLA